MIEYALFEEAKAVFVGLLISLLEPIVAQFPSKLEIVSANRKQIHLYNNWML